MIAQEVILKRIRFLFLAAVMVACSTPGASVPTTTIALPTLTNTVMPTSTALPPNPTSIPVPGPVKNVPESAFLFTQDFESDKPTDDLHGDTNYWKVSTDETGNHIYCKTDFNKDYYPDVFFGQDYWTNYAVEFRAKAMDAQEDAKVSIVARFNQQDYVKYSGEINFNYHVARLHYSMPNIDFGEKGYDTKINTWYWMRLEVAGNKIKYYINNGNYSAPC